MPKPTQIVLIAGGTGGLGRAVTDAFLAQGATVIVTSHHESDLTPTPNLTHHQTDVTNPSAVQTLIDEILATHGHLDSLINTVGAFAGGKPLWDEDLAVFDQMLALNLRSGLLLARAAVKPMLAQRAGSIVNVASKSALDHAAGVAAYAASKAAALALMDCLAADLQGSGVRVNSILPSIIDTEANRKAMPSADFTKWPKPEDIARVILFLCSDDAKVIHGAAIPVYGAA